MVLPTRRTLALENYRCRAELVTSTLLEIRRRAVWLWYSFALRQVVTMHVRCLLVLGHRWVRVRSLLTMAWMRERPRVPLNLPHWGTTVALTQATRALGTTRYLPPGGEDTTKELERVNYLGLPTKGPGHRRQEQDPPSQERAR